jgi:hypothetical protein
MKYGSNEYSKEINSLDINLGCNMPKKGKPRIPPGSSDPVSAFAACFFRNYAFPLMTALVLMLVMVVIMLMLMVIFLY